MIKNVIVFDYLTPFLLANINVAKKFFRIFQIPTKFCIILKRINKYTCMYLSILEAFLQYFCELQTAKKLYNIGIFLIIEIEIGPKKNMVATTVIEKCRVMVVGNVLNIILYCKFIFINIILLCYSHIFVVPQQYEIFV